MKITEKMVLDLCGQVRECDDRLGQVSDYEGNENGPTWYLWHTGKESFSRAIDAVIDDHLEAIKVWKKFKALNNKRKE